MGTTADVKTYEQIAIENLQLRMIVGKQDAMAKAMSVAFMGLQKTELSEAQQEVFDEYGKAYASMVAEGEMAIEGVERDA